MKKKHPNLHAGHRCRMRARFERDGFDSFSDHECLEFILFRTVRRANTNETAHELLARFGSLEGVLSASYEELITVPGVGAVSARYISEINSRIVSCIEEQLSRSGEFNEIKAAVTAEYAWRDMRRAESIILVPLGEAGQLLTIAYIPIDEARDIRHFVDLIMEQSSAKYTLLLPRDDIFTREEITAIGNFTKILGCPMKDAFVFDSHKPISYYTENHK